MAPKQKTSDSSQQDCFLPRTGSKHQKRGVGNVYEISVPQGFAYVHFVFWREDWDCELLRVLPKFYKRPIESTSILPTHDERFYGYTSLVFPLRRRWLRPVGLLPIATKWKCEPEFKSWRPPLQEGGNPRWVFCKDAKKHIWKNISVEDMTPRQRELPDDGIAGFDIFFLRIASNWRPTDDLMLKAGQVHAKERKFLKAWPEYEKRFAEYIKSGWKKGKVE